VSEAIVAAALVVAALNGACGLLGGWLWLRDAAAVPAARVFWVLLRVAQGSALTLAIAVGSLAAAGKSPREDLFYLYALLPLAVAFIAEQLRALSAQTILDQRGLAGAAAVGELPQDDQRLLVGQILRREMGVMALSALVVVFLALRGAATAHGF
jgi:hypothetical protein